MEKLYILDISNMIHRAYHAMGDLSNSKGFPTGAIYGTTNMLINFAEKHKPRWMCVCYDTPTAIGFRKSIYPEYKANRGPSIEAISMQEKIIRAIIRSLGICTVEIPRYEADDAIASVTNKFKDKFEIVVVTGDKDMLVLADKNISIYDSMKFKYYGEEDVESKFGVKSYQISDFLAIAGDTVDNIKGVPGIGKVGAQKLLKRYTNIDDIYNNLHEIEGKVREKLESGRESCYISKQLTTLQSNLNIDIAEEDIYFGPVPDDRLIELFDILEIKNFIPKLKELYKYYEDNR